MVVGDCGWRLRDMCVGGRGPATWWQAAGQAGEHPCECLCKTWLLAALDGLGVCRGSEPAGCWAGR
jgi:hypothetical protein